MKSKVELNSNYLQVQELERKRIAQELHDTSLQNLTHIIHEIELVKLCIDNDKVKAKLELENISVNIKSIINDTREKIFNLSPMILDDLGFYNTIEQYFENIKKQNIFNLEIDIDSISINDSGIAHNVYRIIQECFNNIIKHAKAKNVKIKIKAKNNELHIQIQDDGVGFETDKFFNSEYNSHFGLRIMKDRVELLDGCCDIISEIGKGTNIIINIPYKGDIT